MIGIRADGDKIHGGRSHIVETRGDVLSEMDTGFVAEGSSLASRGAHERKFATRKPEPLLITSGSTRAILRR